MRAVRGGSEFSRSVEVGVRERVSRRWITIVETAVDRTEDGDGAAVLDVVVDGDILVAVAHQTSVLVGPKSSA